MGFEPTVVLPTPVFKTGALILTLPRFHTINLKLAPRAGIEPALTNSKSVVLPLDHLGINTMLSDRIELSTEDYDSSVIPFN